MSFVSYNGVSIPYALTKVHQTGPVMDPSGSDELYLKIRLEAEGPIDPDFRASLPLSGSPTGESMLKYIRHLLCQPRKRLYYDTEFGQGGTASGGGPGPNALINQLPLERDDANGPLPDSTAIDVTYTTPNVIYIKFAVETYIRDCGPRTLGQPLSIRWEESVDFNDSFQCTLTRTGTAVISSLSTISIDTVRRVWVTPAIPRGFARKAANYQMSRDGLRCDFRFVDVQLQYAPPAPAVSLDIVQSEETTPTGVGYRNGTISVRVRGFVGTDPVRLMEIAAQVATMRLNAARPQTSSGGLIIGATKFATEETIDGASVTLVRTYRTRIRTLTATAAARGVLAAPSSFRTSAYLPLNYGWVGYGSSRRTGYADWASDSLTAPTGVIGVRPDGVGLARAVGFFSALLRDPCGSVMPVTPYAAPSVPTRSSGTSTLTSSTGGIFPGGGASLSARVDAPVGGGTTRSNDWSGFLTGGAAGILGGVAAGVGAATGEGSAVQLLPDATAAPTTPALVTAVLAEYTAAEGPTGLTEEVDPFVAADLAPGIYTLWQCYNEFDTDQGNVVVPTCNPEAPLVQIKHSANVLTFRKKWTATKIGSPPAVPTIEQGDNLVLVRKFVGLPNVNVTANGSDFEYRVDGVYEYVALDPTDVRYLADSPPFLAPTWAAKTYDWADVTYPKQLSDNGKTAAYFAGTGQPPAGVYDYPVAQYVNSLGTGNTTSSTLSGTPPQPGGSTGPNGVPVGGTDTGAGTAFSIGVGGKSVDPGTAVFGGAASATATGTNSGTAVVPNPPAPGA